MKTTFTSMRALLVALTCLFAIPTVAQELQGYIKVFVRVLPSTEGSGKVSVLPPSGGLDTYKTQYDFQKVLPVAMDMIYFKAKANPTSGYQFGGWYFDNGDGQFDMTKDEYINAEKSTTIFVPLALMGFTDETPIFSTENEAAMAPAPTEPQVIIYAHFTNGATVMVDHTQEHCGTVEISKPLNTIGDIITIKAIPAEGYEFKYWKTGQGSQIMSQKKDTSVSTEAEWTFEVKGGECYYAYFQSVTAPTFDFAPEGEWKTFVLDRAWILDEQADAMIYNPNMGDIITNDKLQTYFNLDDEDAWYDSARGNQQVTLMYGKGHVNFTHYIPGLAFDRRDNILLWSGSKGLEVKDPNQLNYYVYAFKPSLNAFVQIGTTDEWAEDRTESVSVPKNTCYLQLEAERLFIELSDNTEYIPKVIGMSPEAFDQATLGINTLSAEPSGFNRGLFDLQGRRLSKTPAKGLYIMGGKKHLVK